MASLPDDNPNTQDVPESQQTLIDPFKEPLKDPFTSPKEPYVARKPSEAVGVRSDG